MSATAAPVIASKADIPLLLRPFQLIGRTVLAAFREVGRISVFSARVLFACLTPVIYVREFFRQCMKIGFYSLPVVGLTAIFIGAALALNIYQGGSRFNAEQFMPQIVVLGIARELGPTLAGLMLAGRVSAGIAAEIGAMRVTEQIDALLTLSANPFRFLHAPRVLAATLTLPLLVVVADIIGVMGGWLVSVGVLNFNGATYLRNTWAFVKSGDIASGLIKAAIFGAVIALMGCYQGDRSKGGAGGVGRAATLAVVGAAVLILAFNYILTSIFVRIGL
jgi:phospholipid/cholesterol/gamma-HCH transport system permease protein